VQKIFEKIFAPVPVYSKEAEKTQWYTHAEFQAAQCKNIQGINYKDLLISTRQKIM
jgi:hypothetical protein